MAKLTIEERFEKGKCLSPEGIVSFPSVFIPSEYNGKKNYRMDLILQNEEDVEVMRKYIELAIDKKFGKKAPFIKHSPLREPNKKPSGAPRDLEKYPEYKDRYYLTFTLDASRNSRPLVLDQDKEEVFDQNDFYAGCTARVVFTPYAYDNGSTGVNLYMKVIVKTAEGERISGESTLTVDDVRNSEDLLED